MKIARRRVLSASLASLAITCGMVWLSGHALAQSAYPARQITIVVSYPTGGDTDALARVFAEKLSTRFGQPVIVENRPGASGTIGNTFVAKAPADGYTLLFTPSTFSIATLVLKSGTGMSYDVLNDFSPIIKVGTQPLFLVVTAASGVNNVGELVAASKAGKLNAYGSPGSGSPMHILGEMFNNAAGTKIAQVPYRGSGPAVVDIVGGHIPFMYTTLGPVQQHVASGKLRNIAVADAKRSSLAMNVPTLAESGINGVEVGAWQGLFGPKGMPADVVKTLNTAMNDILKMPDVVARMTTLATLVAGGEPAVLAKVNADDHNRYAKVIKQFGIQAD